MIASMIRRDAGERWLLIPQPAHAALSGALAARWRAPASPRAPSGAPPPSVVLACARHDDGWIAWEAAAEACPATGRPLDFPEVVLADTFAIWERGPRLVARDDAYAGLLVSCHGEALMAHKLDGGHYAGADGARIRSHMAGQRAFRAALAETATIPAERLAARLRDDLRLLQLTDLISLVLCWREVGARERLAVGEPGRERRWPLAIEVGRAPWACGDEAAGPGGIGRAAWLDPWPFIGRDPVEAAVPAFALAKRSYTTPALRAALAEGPGARLAIRLVPRGGVGGAD
jgi:hypothetical protein